MTHSNQTSGVERGAARVRHNRPSEGVLEFPLPRDVPEVWFQIFLPKKSDTSRETFTKCGFRYFPLKNLTSLFLIRLITYRRRLYILYCILLHTCVRCRQNSPHFNPLPEATILPMPGLPTSSVLYVCTYVRRRNLDVLSPLLKRRRHHLLPALSTPPPQCLPPSWR